MRLSAIGLIVTFGIGLLLPPLGVAAPPPVKVHRIGATNTSSPLAIEALRQGLHERATWRDGTSRWRSARPKGE